MNQQIPHQIVNTNSLRLTLKFNREGILVIRKPSVMPFEKVEAFVIQHIDWIKKHYENAKVEERRFETGENYLYLGKNYKLVIIENKYESVFVQENKIYVFVPNGKNAKTIISKWKKAECEKTFAILLLECFKKMEYCLERYPNLEIKNYKARWGTCYPKKNKISLNSSLIHVDIDLIEYVIFHELSHFVHLNHSKYFHDFLKKFVPDESKKKARLRKFKCYYE